MEILRPSRLVRARLLLAAALAACPALAAAQTQPAPESPEPAPTPTPDPATTDPATAGAEAAAATAAASAVRATSAWDYSAGLGLGWESNVGIDTGQGPKDAGPRLQGTFGYTVRRPTRDFSIAGNGNGYLYFEQVQFNRFDGNLSLELRQRLNERTSGNLALGAGYNHTDNTDILLQQGLLLPLTRTVGFSADAGVSHQTAPRTSLRGSLRAARVLFPDSETFQDSSSVRLSFNLESRRNKRNIVTFEASAEAAAFASGATADSPSTYWTYYASGQWNHHLSAAEPGHRGHLRVELLAGGSYTPDGDTAGLGRTWSFYGGVGVNRRFKHIRFTAYYRREVLPLFGLGRLGVADRFGITADTPWGGNPQAGLGIGYAQEAATSTDGEENPGALEASAHVHVRLRDNLRLSVDGRYLKRFDYSRYADADALRADVIISLTRPRGGGGGR